MSQYYYAVAALPMLFLESEVFPGEQEFLDHCSAWLSDTDFALLSTASLHPSFTFADRGSVLGRWYTIERALRNELVRARASRLRVDEEKYLAGDDAPAWLSAGEIESRASEAFAHENPLRAEQLLDEFRWQVLDQLEVGHYFDLDKLIVYYLKLQMLRRRAAMNREAGTALFEATYKTIIDRYYNPEQDTDQEVETQT